MRPSEVQLLRYERSCIIEFARQHQIRIRRGKLQSLYVSWR